MSEHIYTLVASSNRGRYAGDDPQYGPDLTSNQPVEIEVLDGVWVPGRVHHDANLYHIDKGLYSGYFFESDTGQTIGLCSGMRVRFK